MIEKSEIHEFVRDLLARNEENDPLTNDDSLLMSGRLQSIDAIEIVLFLEQKSGIDFAELGFDRERIDSVDAIYALAQASGH